MLNPGHYFITVGIYDRSNRFAFDHIDYAESFRIEGSAHDYLGSIDLNVQWEI